MDWHPRFEVQGKVLGKISFAEMLVASIVQKARATSARVAPAPAIGLMTAARSQNCTRRRDAISATSCSLSIPAWAKAVGIGEMTVTRQHGSDLQVAFSGSGECQAAGCTHVKCRLVEAR